MPVKRFCLDTNSLINLIQSILTGCVIVFNSRVVRTAKGVIQAHLTSLQDIYPRHTAPHLSAHCRVHCIICDPIHPQHSHSHSCRQVGDAERKREVENIKTEAQLQTWGNHLTLNFSIGSLCLPSQNNPQTSVGTGGENCQVWLVIKEHQQKWKERCTRWWWDHNVLWFGDRQKDFLGVARMNDFRNKYITGTAQVLETKSERSD